MAFPDPEIARCTRVCFLVTHRRGRLGFGDADPEEGTEEEVGGDDERSSSEDDNGLGDDTFYCAGRGAARACSVFGEVGHSRGRDQYIVTTLLSHHTGGTPARTPLGGHSASSSKQRRMYVGSPSRGVESRDDGPIDRPPSSCVEDDMFDASILDDPVSSGTWMDVLLPLRDGAQYQ